MYGTKVSEDRVFLKLFAAALAALFFMMGGLRDCADTASAKPPGPDVTISRMLLKEMSQQINSLRAENKSLKEQIKAEKSVAASRRKAHAKSMIIEKERCTKRLLTEQIRHRKQVSLIKKPPQPVACYVALGICGALVVGVGVGGYYAGQNLRASSAQSGTQGQRIYQP